ncbi:MAG: hypothetical protein HGA31_04990 [Candidatus Moranbacteria bacterium]|nr:hypothetical protein [Candidatus Moranbacteria bacterium]
MNITFHQMGTAEWTLEMLLIVLAVITVITAIGAIFLAFDSWFLQEKEGTGTVIDMRFTDEYFAGRAYIPENWELHLQVGDLQEWISVSKKFYGSVSKGKVIPVVYGSGRFSNYTYLKGV